MTGPSATILVVDDELQNRKLLELLLQPEGYLVLAAASGEEALTAVAERPPDLILLDIMMPGMDGYQVVKSLKGDPGTSRIPIIMVTALVDREARLTGLEAGAEEFLTKPVDRAELYLRVRNLLRLKELGDFQRNHSAILEQQVQARTAELLASTELRHGEAIKQATVLNALPANIALLGSHGEIRSINEAWRQFAGANGLLGPAFGVGVNYLEVCDRAPDACSGGARKAADGIRSVLLGSAPSFSLEYPCDSPTEKRWFLMTVHPLSSGPDSGVAVMHMNITERKENEAKISRLNRVYAVLSGINSLIVRVKDRDKLFKSACRIAVEDGSFVLAWVGIIDRGTMMLEPVASAGTTADHLELINQRFSLDIDAPLGNTFSARAIREKRILVSNDVRNDPAVLFREEHAQRGSRSMAMLPLQIADEVVGILALYSGEPDFFDAEELKLLGELAGDIAFAIDHLGKLARLDYLAYYDELTGLANRRLFLERVAQCIRNAQAGGHMLAVFLVDLERFKNINDSLGQTAGDTLLKQVATWLTANAGGASLLARLGADHFALVLPKVTHEEGVSQLLGKTLDAFLQHPFRLDESVFRVSAKVGAALFPGDGADADILLKHAEAALKNAKAGGDRFLLFSRKMTAKVAGKLNMENQLREALEKGEFVLHFQPKIRLSDGKVSSAEALIRWNDPRTGLVPPGQFIPILEETGLIYDVGRWALRNAVDSYLRWRNAGLAPVRIAVNVSPMQLRNRGFIAEIERIAGTSDDAARGLELEITESLIMEDVKRSIGSLTAIRAMGVRVAIDDFGTGFSSLSHLAKLPVDTLKIDRSFVLDMTVGPDGLALVSTIINLAHSLKLNVVAEGVETEEQSRLLRLLNCDEMQGYLFSRPVPSDVFENNFLAPPVADETGLATSPRFAAMLATVPTES